MTNDKYSMKTDGLRDFNTTSSVEILKVHIKFLLRSTKKILSRVTLQELDNVIICKQTHCL